MAEVDRDLWKSPGPSSAQAGPPEASCPAMWMAFEYLQGWCKCSGTLTVKNVFVYLDI